ncbi:MAG: hypothetical protein IJ658_09380, partial [Kiritimatiellae bacterium]|nr:hypothetical protein [Kiritimatiellia bacterium]
MEKNSVCHLGARGLWGAALVSALAAFAAGAVDIPAPMTRFDMSEVSGETVADASGNGHSLTLGTGVEVVDADIGIKALLFDGTKTAWGKFSCPAVTNTTIAFWLCREATDSSIIEDGVEKNTIPYILSTGYSGFGINWQRNSNGLAFINQANNPQSNFSNFAQPAREQWHHVAVTVEHVGTDEISGFEILECRSYLDGAFQKTITWTNNRAMKTGTQTAVIGNNAASGSGVRPLSGMLADIRFYDVTLRATQVSAVAAEGLSGVKLLMHWPFDEMTANGDGTFSTPEVTGNGSAMTLGANMALADDGVLGKALRFRGSTGLGGKTTNGKTPLYEHTIACWVRRSSEATNYSALVANPYPRLFDGFSSASSGGYAIFDDLAGNTRGFSVMPNGCGTSTRAHVVHGIADVDVWSHLAIVTRLVKEGGDAGKGIVDLYVNGEDVASYNVHLAFDLVPVAAGQTFWLGNNKLFTGNRFFCGDMDDLRIYRGALSSNEVRRVYRGLASIDAGADFTVTGERATLAGTVAASAAGGWRSQGGGYAGE